MTKSSLVLAMALGLTGCASLPSAPPPNAAVQAALVPDAHVAQPVPERTPSPLVAPDPKDSLGETMPALMTPSPWLGHVKGQAAVVPAAQLTREHQLNRAAEWRAVGQISWTPKGGQAHEAHFIWRRIGDQSVVALIGAEGGSGLIRTNTEWLMVDEAGKTTPTTEDALLAMSTRQWGAPLSWERLQDWVRGLHAPGDTQITLDDQNRPLHFEGQQWSVQFDDWQENIPMPAQVTLTHPGSEPVVIVITRWMATAEDASDTPEL